MKKIFALLLTVGMVFGLAGCSGESPLEQYQEILEYNNGLSGGSRDVTMSTDVALRADDESLEMSTVLDVVTDMSDPDSIKLRCHSVMEMMGSQIDMDMYYLDETIYMDVMGQKMKAAIDLVKATEVMGQSVRFVQKEMIQDVTVATAGDDRVFTITCDPETCKEWIEQIVSEQLGDSTTEITYTIQSMIAEVVVGSDNLVKSSTVTAKVDMTAQGETITMDVTMSAVVNAMGEDVILHFPDFSDYIEVDSSVVDLLTV